MNFRVGEKFYLRDLVNAAMIKSANDAANAIAIYLEMEANKICNYDEYKKQKKN